MYQSWNKFFKFFSKFFKSFFRFSGLFKTLYAIPSWDFLVRISDLCLVIFWRRIASLHRQFFFEPFLCRVFFFVCVYIARPLRGFKKLVTVLFCFQEVVCLHRREFSSVLMRFKIAKLSAQHITCLHAFFRDFLCNFRDGSFKFLWDIFFPTPSIRDFFLRCGFIVMAFVFFELFLCLPGLLPATTRVFQPFWSFLHKTWDFFQLPALFLTT